MNAVVDNPEITSGVTYIAPYLPAYKQQVLALAREMHAESLFHCGIAMEDAKVAQQLEAAAKQENTYFRVCVRSGEVLGGFLGTVTSIFFSDEKVAKDIAWFVAKSRRGSAAAVMLVRDFEAWAKQRGAKHFVLGQSTGVHIDTTTALYEHLGYTIMGMNTIKAAR